MSNVTPIINPQSKEDILYIFNSFLIPEAGEVVLANACRDFLLAYYKKYNVNKPIDQTNQIRSSHYGGTDNIYEAIKVIDAWKANFNLGNAIKYICRVSMKYISFTDFMEYPEIKNKLIEDLKKARTYLDFEIEKLEKIK